MSIHELETESVTALPERLETSEFNVAGVNLSQSNLSVQIGGRSMQLASQSNWAGVAIIQSA